jgi:1-acyl-sn-glycerol-3-phosphate acyltransferase
VDVSVRPGRLNNLCFWALWGVVRFTFRICFRLRIEGAPPTSGAYVLAANHVSFADPVFLGAAVPRRLVYLMTEVVYRSRAVGWFYRWNRAIPLSLRSVNRDAMRAARNVLQHGGVVGVFPEGGISRDGLTMLCSPGAVSLVLNVGVPIVPVGILGTCDVLPAGRRWPRLRPVTIRFGEPLTPSELAAAGRTRREQLQGATQLIMHRIAGLTGHEPNP